MNLNKWLLERYADSIQVMATLNSEYDKQKLKEIACRKGLVRWIDKQRFKVGLVGFLTGLPGGLLGLVMIGGDIAYLMAVTGRGCYGIGHILKRQIDYERDIPLIIAVWSGAAHVASTATVGQVAMHVANPIIIQTGSQALVGVSAHVFQSMVGQTGSKIFGLLMPKLIAKLSAKISAQLLAMTVPIFGGVVSLLINRWICMGLMCAAEKYYSSDCVVLEGESTA